MVPSGCRWAPILSRPFSPVAPRGEERVRRVLACTGRASAVKKLLTMVEQRLIRERLQEARCDAINGMLKEQCRQATYAECDVRVEAHQWIV
eukprot:g16023.t1